MAEQRIVDSKNQAPFCIEKCGNVRVPVYQRNQTKNERVYTSYMVAEYEHGKRLLHTFSDPAEAQEKAQVIAKSIAKGLQGSVAEWTTLERIRNAEAVNLVYEAGLKPADFVAGCRLFRDACRLLGGPDQLLIACQFYVANRPNARLLPKAVPEAIVDYTNRRRGKLSMRRARNEVCYLGKFRAEFKSRKLHEISSLELSDMVDRTTWAAKTKSDFLGTISLFFSDAVARGWAITNIAKAVKREKVKSGEIQILTPGECKTLLSSLASDLRPAIALWCFSGLRKEEIARLDWTEVNQGLASGAIFLPARKAKTGAARSIPIAPNLRSWLEKYCKPSGRVLSEQWDGRNLDSLTRHLACVSGITWKANGPRHSYATYSLIKGDSAADIVQSMGNSLRMLERHYWSRRGTITKTTALEWFSIRPEDCAPADRESADDEQPVVDPVPNHRPVQAPV